MKHKLRGYICLAICLMMLIMQPISTYVVSADSVRYARVNGVRYEVRVSYDSDQSTALVTVYNCNNYSTAQRAFAGAFNSVFNKRVYDGEFYNSSGFKYEYNYSITRDYGYLMFYSRDF